MINKLVRYFDQMAEIIRKIEEKGVYREKDFSSLLGDKNHQSYLDLITYFPKLINDDRTFRNIILKDMDESFFDSLEWIIKGGSDSMLHLLLYHMDRGIKECYMQTVGFEDDVEICNALNSNQEKTKLIILRKAECKWAMREIGNGLQGFLENFYYIDLNNLKGMLVKNYMLDPKAVLGRKKDVLKIAISPITDKKIVEFSKPYERMNENTGAVQKLFRVENVLEEEWITEQVFENILLAGSNSADILVFPEMLGTHKMLRCVLDKLTERKDVQIPALIVFPSIWEKTKNDQDNTNRSCVILNGDEILFQQHKRSDYKYDTGEGEVYEDINRDYSKNNVLHMIHVEGLGRICIIICYDYLDGENRESIMENARPTLVCTPSFSTGSFHFETLSEAFFKQNCNWVWCNTCSAINETKRKSNFEIMLSA